MHLFKNFKNYGDHKMSKLDTNASSLSQDLETAATQPHTDQETGALYASLTDYNLLNNASSDEQHVITYGLEQ